MVRGADIAFEIPVTEDMTQTMLVRMGIAAAGGKPPTPDAMRRPPRRSGASPTSTSRSR